MPVLLANADPGFDFVDHARRQAADLFAAGLERTMLADFAGDPQAETGPAGGAARGEPSVARRVWGYWPRMRGGNPILIRDDLEGFAAEAADSRDGTTSWVVVSMRPETLVALADPSAPPTEAPLTRDILASLRRRKEGIAPGATAHQTAEITANLYLRRVFAVASDLGSHPEEVAAAHRLVAEDLVDNVVFLAVRDPDARDLAAIRFAGLRLIEALAGNRGFEAWLAGSLGPLQRGATVVRLAIDRRLAAVPTRGSRRLWFVQRLLERLSENQPNAPSTVRPSAATAVAEVRRRIEAAAAAEAGETAPSIAPISGEPAPPRASWHTDPSFADRLAAAHRAWLAEFARRVAAGFEAAAPKSMERPSGWDTRLPFGDVGGQRLRREAELDREIAAAIDDLSSGAVAGSDEATADLVTGSGRLRDEVRRDAAAQQEVRRRFGTGDVDEAVAFVPPDPRIDGFARPLRLALTGDRAARRIRAVPGAALTAHVVRARELIEAERGLCPGHLRGAAWFVALVAGLTVVSATPVAVVAGARLVDVLTFARPGVGWVWLAAGTLLVAAGLALSLSASACRRASVAWREAGDTVAAVAADRIGLARDYRRETALSGWRNRLRRRLDTLTMDLQSIRRIELHHREIVDWPVPAGSEVDPEAYRSIVGAAVDQLTGLPKARWVGDLLRFELPEAKRVRIRCTLDGTADQTIDTGVFVGPLPDDGTVNLERLT